MSANWETIISVGAEGGSIKLLGKKSKLGEWIFKGSVNEIDYELDEGPLQIGRNDPILYSWNEALTFLNEYPWPMLGPQDIHPDFRKQVWQALKEKLADQHIKSFLEYRFDRWIRLCFPEYSRESITLGRWLQESSYTTILTGAGMSTESNIPDFRSKDGWWKNIDPRTVATVDALHNHYDLFHEFYSKRIKSLADALPHKGHRILASWEKKGLLQAISTQNVDGFHTSVGNHKVYELHGNIRKVRCSDCAHSNNVQSFLKKESCSNCGGNLRPGVVLFGEMLPEDSWDASLSHIQNSELVIVIGTSLEVFPASQLSSLTNGKTVYINMEIDKPSNHFDLLIQGKAGEVLEQVNELLF